MENLRQFLGKRQTHIYTWTGTLMHLCSGEFDTLKNLVNRSIIISSDQHL